jgi:hypothetical protein
MVVTLPPDLAAALDQLARQRQTEVESLVLEAVREKYGPLPTVPTPQDDWQRLVLSAASDCGVALPDEAFGSEALYE